MIVWVDIPPEVRHDILRGELYCLLMQDTPSYLQDTWRFLEEHTIVFDLQTLGVSAFKEHGGGK